MGGIAMTRETILKKALEMANHNIYCTSANMLMTEPKAGFEAEFAEYHAEAEVLRAWLEELADPDKAARAKLEQDIKDAQDGDIEVIIERRKEIKRLQWELERIDEAI
jgi:hypothetical protein